MKKKSTEKYKPKKIAKTDEPTKRHNQIAIRKPLIKSIINTVLKNLISFIFI